MPGAGLDQAVVGNDQGDSPLNGTAALETGTVPHAVVIVTL